MEGSCLSVIELDSEQISYQEVIGEGSFGIVRRGEWRGMSVAIKQLKGTDMSPESEFSREVETMARVCNHSYVIHLVGVVMTPCRCLVTTYYPNGSVYDVLFKRTGSNPIDVYTLYRWATETALGVRHLHYEGVVHRDLACRNLLLDDTNHIRVSDFGLSRVKAQDETAAYTRSNFGPIRWTAPEAMRQRKFSERSDAFSFGVVLYEMFAQAEPWAGYDLIDVVVRVCEGERMNVPETVPSTISLLMERLWSQKPGDRPDMTEIIHTLSSLTTPSDSGEESESRTGVNIMFSLMRSQGLAPDGTTTEESGLSVGSESTDTSPNHFYDMLSMEEANVPVMSALSVKVGGGDDGNIEHKIVTRQGARLSDREFLMSFESQTLTGWGHESFLRLVYVVLQSVGRSSASVDSIQTKLRAFQKDGFHMTISYFWIQLVTYHMELCKQDVMTSVFDVDNSDLRLLQFTFLEFIQQKHCQQLRNPLLYLEYYSEKQINKGAVDFFLPDKKPLPSMMLPTKP